jgi:glycosyltransferase involved in cell wall biosynthesis
MDSPAPRVIVVGQLPPPTNGMTRMTETVLKSSLARTFDLVHVDTSDHRDAAAIGRIDVRNVWLGLRHALAFCRALGRRPDICYVPIARSRIAFLRDLGFLLPARLLGRIVVLHLHSRDFVQFYDGEATWMRFLIRLAFGARTHAVVLGESRRKDFGDLIPAGRVHVVPNGIADVGCGAPAHRRSRIVLHLSSLRREKGVFAVLSTALASKDIPGVEFVIAGDWRRPDEQNEAEEFVRAHELENIVRFVGTVSGEAKSTLLRQAAVMLFPSAYPFEGHPVVLLEALSAGTPVVATAFAAIPEMLEDGESGFLVTPGDAQTLAARVAELLTDEEVRGRMGHNARRRYEALFTDEIFAERLGSVWTAALAPSVTAASGREPAVTGDTHA